MPMNQTQTIEQLVRVLRRKAMRKGTTPMERTKIESRMMDLQGKVAHLYLCMAASSSSGPSEPPVGCGK